MVRESDENEERNRDIRFHENVILIIGFLGAIVFAGLVLIIQSPNFILHNPNFNGTGTAFSRTPTEYFDTLVWTLAITVELSAILVIASLAILAEPFRTKGFRFAREVIEILTIIVFFMFLFSVYLILIPVSGTVALSFMGVSLLSGIAVFSLLLVAQSRR